MFNQARETKFVVTTAELSMPLALPLMILCCFSQLLAAAAYIFGLLERYSGIAKLRTGGKPSERPQNYAFLVKYTWTIMTFFSLAAMIIEIIIFVKKDILIALRSRIVRGLFYLIKGIGTLGAAGNIGQAAGAFEIISAIVIIAIEAIFIIRGGRGGGDGAYQEARDDGFRQAT